MRLNYRILGTAVSVAIWGAALAQQQPLINYATQYGEFDFDFYRGNHDVGMIRDGVAEGFSFSIPSGFTAELDEVDKVSGRAAQKISFNRNSSSTAEASLSMLMYFPSNDYPRPGETIRISLWVKAENWVNASLRVRARGIDSSGSVDLINTSNPPNAWTELVFNYTVPNSNPQGVRLDLIVRSNAGVSSGVVHFDKLEVTGSKRWRPHQPRSLKIAAPYYSWAEENQRDWVYYAREFDLLLATWDDIKALRTHRSDLLNVYYYNLIYSFRTPDRSWQQRDLFGYYYCDTNHPDWFLLNIYGNRQQFGSDRYAMDIGNPQASAWAAQNVGLSMLYADPGVDVIHFDSFIDFFFLNFLFQKYPTRASRMAAMHKHLINMRNTLSERDVKFIINTAEALYTRDQPHTYFLRQGLLDGLLMEQVFTTIYSLPAEVSLVLAVGRSVEHPHRAAPAPACGLHRLRGARPCGGTTAEDLRAGEFLAVRGQQQLPLSGQTLLRRAAQPPTQLASRRRLRCAAGSAHRRRPGTVPLFGLSRRTVLSPLPERLRAGEPDGQHRPTLQGRRRVHLHSGRRLP
jgi:hypothetical protein